MAEVRERADIVSVVSRHVTLRPAGSSYKGLCPFHDEKTPSFQVSPDKQIYHCFGCGAGGDIFSFLMRQGGLDFPEAVRELARELAIEIPDGEGAPVSSQAPLFRANELALEFFRSALRSTEGEPARRYLAQRGVDEEILERFQIGFAPPRWDGLIQHLRRARFSLPIAEQAGLVVRRQTAEGHYDRFRGRIVFPIADPSGHILGFGGRSIGDEEPKYLNSAESPIYRKSRVLFGLPLALDAARRAGRIVVVEGYFDAVALHRAGLREVVAPCGTALSAEHAKRLHRYASDVVLLFDGDEAGQRAAERVLPILLAEGLRVRAAVLPGGDDPDELLQHKGAGALRAAIDSATPLLDMLIEQALLPVGRDPVRAADAVRRIRPFLRAIADPIERETYKRNLASQLGLPVSVLEDGERASSGTGSARSRSQPLDEGRLDPTSRELIGALASFPEDLLPLVEALPLDCVPEGRERELLAHLIAAARRYGSRALACLVSPAASDLSEADRRALSGIAASHPARSLAAAERAVRDCVARLRRLEIERCLREVSNRLESCTDPELEFELLEQQQRYMTQRRELCSPPLLQ